MKITRTHFNLSRTSAGIRDAKEEMKQYDNVMRLLVENWRYETLSDVVQMRNALTARYNKVDKSFQPLMNRVWDLLRRLTNLYDDQVWTNNARSPPKRW